MKILLLNQAFYPDVVSTAQHAGDLAMRLTQAGHDVTVVSSSRGYDNPGIRFAKRERWNGINIIRDRIDWIRQSYEMASCNGLRHVHGKLRFSFVAAVALRRRAGL